MSTELIINASLPETRIALMENGEIQELLIERASGKGIVGNIYKGRVTRVLPGMQAAFVDIGLEKAAFLYVDDVFVHSEIWAEEEGEVDAEVVGTSEGAPEGDLSESAEEIQASEAGDQISASAQEQEEDELEEIEVVDDLATEIEDDQENDSSDDQDDDESEEADALEDSMDLDDEEDEDEEDDDKGPVGMGAGPDDGDDENQTNRVSPKTPEGTVSPQGDSDREGRVQGQGDSDGETLRSFSDQDEGSDDEGAADASGDSSGEAQEGAGSAGRADRTKRHRRGRRGGRNRKRERSNPEVAGEKVEVQPKENYPENYYQQLSDSSNVPSDRSMMSATAEEGHPQGEEGSEFSGRPGATGPAPIEVPPSAQSNRRPEFREPRARDRRIKTKATPKPVRGQVNIQSLLQEGQEVLVQVAKDPIATKGARLTCHISLPGRHLVCMPTIDHVGVSRRIEREDERRRLREYVERNRPKNLGFIVRTASGKAQSEKRIKQDIDYLTRLWNEIREKAAAVTAPALVYEDLNSVLRAIRDWVTEDIDRIVVDSRYHYNEMQRFVSHFMPSLRQKVELYHGDIPIFDAYNISTELSRAMERKVWLKSGGYLVIDQAEALVAIDVNTGRFVGKKNLEDTILKTNLEAVQEIAYQLRLRNCGGIIILDLIDMDKEENKYRVYRALEEALKKDRARPSILKISELGLIEMTRKRTRDTIIRSLCESCSHCEGKGFIKSKQTVAYEVMRDIEREGIERDVTKILIQSHPDVIDILAIDERETLDQMERRYRKQIYLQAVPDFHPEQFEVVSEKRNRPERADETPLERARAIQVHPENSRESGGGGRGDRERSGRRGRGRDRNREGRDNNSRDSRDNRGDRDQERNAQDREPREPKNENRTVITVTPNGASVQSGQITPNSPAVPQVRPVDVEPGQDYDYRQALNSYPSAYSDAQGAGNATGQAPAANNDDFFDEEDRLAFLRAQAAQDAALANLSASSPLRTTPQGNNRGGQNRNNEGGQNRWGRGGGGRNNNKKRRGSGRGGRFNNQNRDRDRNTAPRATDEGRSDSGSGSDGGGENGGGGGGGDHSTPPTV